MVGVILVRRFLNGSIVWQTGKSLYAARETSFSTFVAVHRTFKQCNGFGSSVRDSLCMRQSQKHALYLTAQRAMAGHSHWQNIKSTKEANEAKHQAAVLRFISLIKGAVAAGGPDPNKNKTLENVIEKMRKAQIPKADIKRYLENATKKAETTRTMYLEVRGPSGSMFVLEIESENPTISRNTLSSLLKKSTGKIQQQLSFQNFFDMKGVITVPVTKDMQVSNMEEYIEIAIETGAEDVILTKNENAEEGDPELVLKFHCDSKTYQSVAREIEDTYNLEVSSCRVDLFPLHLVSIDSESEIEECNSIAAKLQKHNEFVHLFDNISFPEDR